MKIIVISARYPPYHFGGYGLRLKDIADELYKRGHIIQVISSEKETDTGTSEPQPSYPAHRKLHIYPRRGSLIDALTRRGATHAAAMPLVFLRNLFYDLQDLAFVDRQIKQFQPQVIYLGHLTSLTHSLLPYLAGLGLPLVYDEGGSGLIDAWEEKSIWYKLTDEVQSRCQLLNALKTLVIKIVTRISRGRLKPRWVWPDRMSVIFNSHLNHRNAIEHGVALENARVVHSGIDLEKFTFRRREAFGNPLTILVPGRIEPRKGQLDAVRLLKSLQDSSLDAKVIFAGERWSADYAEELRWEIERLALADRVVFLPAQTHACMADLYHQADICFFPSIFKTGFSRIPLEAMACGCLVIAYGNEGSDEVIQNNRNGYLVQPADFEGIRGVLEKLLSFPDVYQMRINDARRVIEKNYSMINYIDSVEAILLASIKV